MYKKLKEEKAYGIDNTCITNEFLKASSGKMLSIYAKLFNVILNTGFIPTDWSIGIIRPIYKKKGSHTDPNNYRGITILSCFSKLFTCVLNERIKSFLDDNNLLGQEQTGFRNGYSTMEHLFTLYGIIDILQSKSKKLYCAFLDLEKAFDTINRAYLWEKILKTGIQGKILKVIVSLYIEAKSCVVINKNGKQSEYFRSKTGVRQGENLSPILFALFLNDMKDFLKEDMEGLPSVAREARNGGMAEEDVNSFLELFLLLYADDSVIFSENVKGLQTGLDRVKTYCDKFSLKLNAKKCKVVVFSKGKIRNIPRFFIGQEMLEVVSDFTYLGLKLNYNNKLTVAQKDLYDRATRAMFALLKKSQIHNLPLDLVLDLFDSMVLPVLTYGCEIWGFEINECVCKLQLKFYKFLLRLRQSTPSMMVLGEVGKFPISVNIKSRLLTFWFKVSSKENKSKLSNLMYRCLHILYQNGTHKSKYLSFVENTLNELGLTNLWTNQHENNFNPEWFKEKVKRSLKDQFIQSLYTTVDNESIYTNYRMFKREFSQDSFFKLIPQNYSVQLVKFRTTNNKAPVNSLRFTRTIRADRICNKCNYADIGDEYHYLFVCPFFHTLRQQYIPQHLYNRPNSIKYNTLMTTTDKKTLLNLTKFIRNLEKQIDS